MYCKILDEDIENKESTSNEEVSKISDDVGKEGKEFVNNLTSSVEIPNVNPELQSTLMDIFTELTGTEKMTSSPYFDFDTQSISPYETMVSSPYDLIRDLDTLTRIVDILSSDAKNRILLVKNGLEKVNTSLEFNNGKIFLSNRGVKKEVGDLNQLDAYIKLENGIIDAKSYNCQAY